MTPVTGEQLDGRSQLGSDTVHLTEASEYGERVCWPSVAEWSDVTAGEHAGRVSRNGGYAMVKRYLQKSESVILTKQNSNDSLTRPQKLRKAAVFFTTSVSTEQLGSYYTDFHEIRHFAHFTKNLSRKFQVSLKSDTNNGHFTEDLYIFMITSRSIFLTARNISDTKLYRNIV